MSYLRSFSGRATSQGEPLPGRTDSVKNNAGGFGFAVDKWQRLRRFLILGSEGGTYYVREPKLTRENAENVIACIREDGRRTVDEIVRVSDEGLAYKNDPALFALALANSRAYASEETRRAALAALPKVARIGTHLFHFLQFADDHKGASGRQFRRAVGRWYLERKPDALAMQLVKYRQRDGWTHRDVLRLTHPKATGATAALLRWAVGKPQEADAELPRLVEGFEKLQKAENVREAAQLITAYGLPREAVPTELLAKPEVWAALLPHMGLTACVRNLGNMTRIGLLAPLSEAVVTVCQKLTDEEVIRKERVHPLQFLAAICTYGAGHGARSTNSWTPVAQVRSALEAGFYKSFKSVQPTGKRTLLAIDVSGSMRSGEVGGVPGLSPAMASAAMAMVIARTEPRYHVMGFAHDFRDLGVTAEDSLSEAMRKTNNMNFGATDCALPWVWARVNSVEVDTCVTLTDSETWSGSVHPTQALAMYRQIMGVPARSVVAGMVSNGFTVADPRDAGQMDVVGFDAGAPQVIADFSAGRM